MQKSGSNQLSLKSAKLKMQELARMFPQKSFDYRRSSKTDPPVQVGTGGVQIV